MRLGLWLAGLFGLAATLLLTTHSAQALTLSEFSHDGNEYETFQFNLTTEGPPAEIAIKLPGGELVEAGLIISADGSNAPQAPRLSAEGETLWAYAGEGYGALGRQTLFGDSSTKATLNLNDSTNRPPKLLLPVGAEVTQARLQLAGYPEPDENWQTANSLEGPGNATNVKLAADGQGYLYALFWQENSSGESLQLSQSKDNGSTWSEPRTVVPTGSNRLGSGHWRAPAIVATEEGGLHLVWIVENTSSGADELYLKTRDGTVWLEPELLASADAISHLQAAHDLQGLHLAWYARDRGQGSLYYLANLDREPLVLAQANLDSLALATDGDNIAAVWSDALGLKARFSHDGGATFGPPRTLPLPEPASALAAAWGDKALHLFWQETRNGTGGVYHASLEYNWSEPTLISIKGQPAYFPALAVQSGMLGAAFVGYNPGEGQYDIFWTHALESQLDWSDPFPLSIGLNQSGVLPSAPPSLLLGAQAHLAWADTIGGQRQIQLQTSQWQAYPNELALSVGDRGNLIWQATGRLEAPAILQGQTLAEALNIALAGAEVTVDEYGVAMAQIPLYFQGAEGRLVVSQLEIVYQVDLVVENSRLDSYFAWLTRAAFYNQREARASLKLAGQSPGNLTLTGLEITLDLVPELLIADGLVAASALIEGQSTTTDFILTNQASFAVPGRVRVTAQPQNLTIYGLSDLSLPANNSTILSFEWLAIPAESLKLEYLLQGNLLLTSEMTIEVLPLPVLVADPLSQTPAYITDDTLAGFGLGWTRSQGPPLIATVELLLDHQGQITTLFYRQNVTFGSEAEFDTLVNHHFQVRNGQEDYYGTGQLIWRAGDLRSLESGATYWPTNISFEQTYPLAITPPPLVNLASLSVEPSGSELTLSLSLENQGQTPATVQIGYFAGSARGPSELLGSSNYSLTAGANETFLETFSLPKNMAEGLLEARVLSITPTPKEGGNSSRLEPFALVSEDDRGATTQDYLLGAGLTLFILLLGGIYLSRLDRPPVVWGREDESDKPLEEEQNKQARSDAPTQDLPSEDPVVSPPPLLVDCPGCGQAQQVTTSQRPLTLKCKSCQAQMEVNV